MMKELSKLEEVVGELSAEVVFDGGMGGAVIVAATKIALQRIVLEVLSLQEIQDLSEMRFEMEERCWDCECPVEETEEKELVKCLACEQMVCRECWREHRKLEVMGVH